jgi:apolipoprotein N-acyltransferase
VTEPTRSRRPSRDLVLRLVGAAIAGAALVLAFPPYDLWPLAVPSAAALVLLCRGGTGRRGALIGLLYGLVFFAGLMPWLRVIGWDAWALLSLECAAWMALLGLMLAVVTALPWWPLWSAAVWVVEEALRDRIPFGGFPWGRLAFAQPDTSFTGLAALGGAPLVSFAVALSAGLLAWAVVSWRRWPVLVGGIVAAVLVAVAGLAVPRPTDGTPVTVAVVQGNVPGTGMNAFGRARAVLDNHVSATIRLAADVAKGSVPQPDFVVWPENSSDVDPSVDASAKNAIDTAAKAIGVPILVGIVTTTPGGQYLLNTGVVWDPHSGPGAVYVKRHPVPFGEYVPFRSLLSPFISRLSRIPRDYAPGHEPGVLPIDGTTVGDVICFEVAYDSIVRDVVTGGGQLITVQTNNATYGHTGQVEQQFAITQLRSVEHARAVAVAATSGISGLIEPDGKVIASTPEFVAESLVSPLPQRGVLTLADRLGSVPELVLVMVGVAAILVAAVRRRRTDRTQHLQGGTTGE